ncbi:MAG: hypothetical protein ACXVBR_12655 [Flavisolibacter sp.]
MSLNEMHLTNQLLADLYTDMLIDFTPAGSPPPKAAVRNDLKYLGKNARHIVVLVDQERVPFLPDNELGFLTSILSACKLSLADVAIVNRHSLAENEVLPALRPLVPQKVLLFGMTPESIDLPFYFPPFQLQPFDGCTYLHGPTLQELEKDKNLKMQLWNSLKNLFGL